MTQSHALRLMAQGLSIFLTGPPGSGKSYVLEQFVELSKNRGKQVAVTASSGIAASLLSGVTIHSWSGVGINKTLTEIELNRILSDERLRQRLNETEILIIDEISMLESTTLDTINQLLGLARNSKQPFGGLQVILSGDFFQLPPISRGAPKYAFEAVVWSELKLTVCYLSEQFRQRADELSEILSALRDRRFERRHLDLLMARLNVKQPQSATALLTHNREVNQLNLKRLVALSGQEYVYKMRQSGSRQLSTQLARSILAPNELRLKVGAAVMFIANDFIRGFANGTQGMVVGFSSGLPLVKLSSNGLVIKVEAHHWFHEVDGVKLAEATQLPIRLAWALTIHKCQGMSLNMANINLSRSFVSGMGYVALSRLRSYAGLYLSGLNSRSLQLDDKIYTFDLKLRSEETISPTSNIAHIKGYMLELDALLAAKVSRKFIKLSLGLTEKDLRRRG